MEAEAERERNNEVPHLFLPLSWRGPQNSKITYTPNIVTILM
jgi:hypothetical protein